MMGNAIPGKVVLNCIKKQTEQDIESKPLYNVFPGLCFCSCPEFLSG